MALEFRPLALIFRVAAVFAIAAGIVRISDLFSGDPTWTTFLFYTVQSNVLCLVWMLLLAVWTARDLVRDGTRGTSTPSARISGGVMMAITVTMLIYLIVLVPSDFVQAGDYVPFTLTDNLIHVITPCLLIADWLLFVCKGAFRWVDPLLWALIPGAYLVFAFTFSALGGEFGAGVSYPYPFMDVDALGLAAVALWIAGLAAALVAVGYVFVIADRMLGAAATRERRA